MVSHFADDSNMGRDANVLIMELNKGLQSMNLGEQCKAIAQFPNLLEKFPFPVIINSIFLKIVQIFCDSSNYLRLCVLRACSKSTTHIAKLTVGEDIVRKLMPFMASNDPAARALTIRLFGTLNQVTGEHLGVHNAVLQRIESHYEVEVDAAIWTSHIFASISSVYSISLCSILCKHLNELSTDLHTKLKLLRLGMHMHHDAQTAEQIRHCLQSMLSSHNTSEFVVSIMETLTFLESRAPLYTSEQVDLLLLKLCNDGRVIVRRSALRNLASLAEKVPHHWTSEHVNLLCSAYISSKSSDCDRKDILGVFDLLVNFYGTFESFSTSNYDTAVNPMMCLRKALLTFPASELTLKAIQVACKMAIHLANTGVTTDPCVSDAPGFVLPDQLAYFLVSHFLAAPQSPESGRDQATELPWYLVDQRLSVDELKCTYSLMAEFFTAYPHLVTTVREMHLIDRIHLGGGRRLELVCQFLSTLVSRLPLCLHPVCVLLPADRCDLTGGPSRDFTALLTGLSEAGSVAGNGLDCSSGGAMETRENCVLSAVGLLFQMSGTAFLSEAESTRLLTAVMRCLAPGRPTDEGSLEPGLPLWLAYKLARQANRYGQHEFAGRIYLLLVDQTISERTHYWLRGLHEFSQLEANLVRVACELSLPASVDLNSGDGDDPVPTLAIPEPRISRLVEALQRASDAAFKAKMSFVCVGGPDVRWFQVGYVYIRGRLCSCLGELCASAAHHNRIARCRHPASRARGVSRENLACRAGPQVDTVKREERLWSTRTAGWLRIQLQSWESLIAEVSELKLQCLDADARTHEHLLAIIQLISFFVQLIQSLLSRVEGSSKDVGIFEQVDSCDPYSRIMPHLLECAEQVLRGDSARWRNFDWLCYFVLQVAKVSAHWPRFFFQRLQTTSVRLVLLPRASEGSSEDVLTIHSEVEHMVQAMGVVNQRCRLASEKQQLLCKVTGVEINLSVVESKKDSQRNDTPISSTADSEAALFSSTRFSSLQGDYFHVEFCIPFPTFPSQVNGPERMYTVCVSTVLLDASGTRWYLTRSSGTAEETALIRVEQSATSRASAVLLSSIASLPFATEAQDSAKPNSLHKPATAQSSGDVATGSGKQKAVVRLMQRSHLAAKVRTNK